MCVCVCVSVCVCVCLRKEEGVGNGVCPLSHRLERSTKCIIMVCNHWFHPVSINFDYPISWCYLLIK